MKLGFVDCWVVGGDMNSIISSGGSEETDSLILGEDSGKTEHQHFFFFFFLFPPLLFCLAVLEGTTYGVWLPSPVS